MKPWHGRHEHGDGKCDLTKGSDRHRCEVTKGSDRYSRCSSDLTKHSDRHGSDHGHSVGHSDHVSTPSQFGMPFVTAAGA